MKDNITLEQILNQIWWHGESYGTGLVTTQDGTKDENTTTAAQTIRTLIKECLPEKIPSKFMPVKDMQGNKLEDLELLSEPDRAFNECLDQITESLKQKGLL